MSRERSKTTAEKRKNKVETVLKDLGGRVYQDLDAGRFPSVTFASRSVRNIVYDRKLQQFILGSSSVRRSAGNIKHIRPFTQLLWLAYFSKKLVNEKKTSTLRDVYYSAQAFDVEFQDQAESDELITDLEVVLGSAREEFNVYPEERSAIFGDLTIEYTVPGYEGKTLDLSSHPDGVMIGPALTTAEFRNTDADMVLAIEKGGLFTRFVEEKVHKKYKAILVNTAGQPPRSTRYLLRRLHEEMKLPIGILCDADPWGAHIAMVIKSGSVKRDEPVMIRDASGRISMVSIGEFVDECIEKYGSFTDSFGDETCAAVPFEVLTVDQSNKVSFKPMSAAIRHMYKGVLFTIRTQSGRAVTVTPNHSVFVLRKGDITSIPTSEIQAGDLLVMNRKVSEPTKPTVMVDVIHELVELSKELPLPKLYVHIKGIESKWHNRRKLASFGSAEKKLPRLGRHPGAVFVSSRGSGPADLCPARIWMTKQLARLLGYYTSEGWVGRSKGIPRNVNLCFNIEETDVLEDAEDCVRSVFPGASIQKTYDEENHAVTLRFGATPTACLFFRLCGKGYAKKRVPSVMFGLDKEFVLEYLKGCFGDGYVDNSASLCWKMKNPGLIVGLSYLIGQLGVISSFSQNQNVLYVTGKAEVAQVASTVLHPDDRNFVLQHVESTNRSSYLMPKSFPVIASGLIEIKSELVRHQYHTPRCKNAYRRMCELIQLGHDGGMDRANVAKVLDHILSCDLHKPSPEVEARVRNLLELVTSDISFDPVAEIRPTEEVEEYVYDVSVPGVERFIGGRAGILLHNSAGAAHLRDLTTPSGVWLGVTASDIVKYKLPSDPLTEIDIKRLYELKADPRYKDKMWHEELDMFLKIKKKSEQEAFSRYGLSYIVDTYLPDKLQLMKSA